LVRRIPNNDVFGIFYVKKPDGVKWDSYYRTLDSLGQLFEDEQFRKTVSGFYLNVIGDFDSVRISYFVDKAKSERAISIFEQFFRDNEVEEIEHSSRPSEKSPSKELWRRRASGTFQKLLGFGNANRVRVDQGRFASCKKIVRSLSLASQKGFIAF